ncbi:uncharacterized protein LOC135942508 [Cloeon dipterum]|uniref:uncharacterized protein LOC135942508 n=1 Tax=Cloeon dipterum TaxID=197152 RepID=UPI0032201AB9
MRSNVLIWIFLAVGVAPTVAKDKQGSPECAQSLEALQNIVKSENDIIHDLLTTMVSEERDSFRVSHVMLHAIDTKLTQHQKALSAVLHNILDRMRLSEGATTFVGTSIKLENVNAEEEDNAAAAGVPTAIDEKYYISSSDGFKWSAALEFCSSHNWSLASPRTIEELSLIWSMVPNKDGWYWTSACADAGQSAGRFFWHGTLSEVACDLWAKGQPNELIRDSNACAALNNGHLFDQECSFSNHFICQKF